MSELHPPLTVLAALILATAAAAQPISQLDGDIRAAAEREYPSLESVYTHLHRNPELSFFEEKTGERRASRIHGAYLRLSTDVTSPRPFV